MGSDFRAIKYEDGPDLDAFGRLRTAGTGQRLDVEFNNNKQPDFFDEITNNGTATHVANTRGVTLATSSATTADYAELRSHPVPYTPGNSQLAELTGVLDFAAVGGGTVEVFLRSKISGTTADLTTVTQGSWVSNTSGVDWADSQIFMVDFQSLKVGRIRFALNQGGVIVPVASIENDNLRNSGYWQNPNLPVFYKVYHTATNTICELGYGNADNAIGFRYIHSTTTTSATLSAICCTVKSEGGLNLQDMIGLPRSISTGVTSATVGTTEIPLITIRPKATFNSIENLGLALPRFLTVQTDNPILLRAYLDTTLSAGTTTFADVDTTNSMMEYNTGATAFTGGHVILDDYVATSKNVETASKSLLGKAVLWDRQGALTGNLTITGVRTTGTSASVFTGINWEEIR